ncbi:MAG: flavin reductase family protein [Chloroherpetonaceae bacterium]|nr:flavin reductase family protein [Chloroherpetonaceae bacterium]
MNQPERSSNNPLPPPGISFENVPHLHEKGGMRDFSTEALSAREAYQLLISTIVPRPIAFVSTVGEEGLTNAAPFSFFTALNAQPMFIAFSIISPKGKKKDTLRNIEWAQDFVVNMVDETLADPMNATAFNFPPEISELEFLGIQTVKSLIVKAPRIESSPVQMECKLISLMPLTEEVTLIIGKVLHVHVRESLFTEDGKINQNELKVIGAMGGNRYCCVENTFELKRPEIKL